MRMDHVTIFFNLGRSSNLLQPTRDRDKLFNAIICHAVVTTLLCICCNIDAPFAMDCFFQKHQICQESMENLL